MSDEMTQQMMAAAERLATALSRWIECWNGSMRSKRR